MGSEARKRIGAENGRGGSLIGLLSRMPDEESCARWLLEHENPGGWRCPRCGCATCSPVRGRPHSFQCTRCRKQVSVTAGTCMHGTKAPLRAWVAAMWLASHSRRGVSGLELARVAGVSENCADYMLRRLRAALASPCAHSVLDGAVELDDFYVGARRGGVGRGTRKSKMIACVEEAEPGGRRGRCVIRSVEGIARGDYRLFAHDHVCRSAEVHSDMWVGIRGGLAAWGGLDARPFDASDPVASLPVAHHVISNFKAFLAGTCHGVRDLDLQSRADEFSWRYSHRDSDDPLGDMLAAACAGRIRRADIPGLATAQPEQPMMGHHKPRRAVS